MFRYSLTAFMLATGVAALVFAGLASPNELTMRIVATTTLAILLASVITAMAWRNEGRWFWVGFALAGWSYVAIAVYGGAGAKRLLFTEYMISRLDYALQTSVPSKPPTGESVRVRGDDVIEVFPKRNMGRFGQRMTLAEAKDKGYWKYAYTDFTIPQRMHFYSICHYLFSLVLGCVGGLFSLYLRRSSQPPTDGQSTLSH